MAVDIKDLAKTLGVFTIHDDINSTPKHVWPFKCAPIDIVFGGGVPSGRIIELFGWEAGGKSTLGLECTKAFTNYQKETGNEDYAVLWIESEAVFDKVRATYMKCEVGSFLIQEVEICEDGFKLIKDTVKKCAERKIALLIVWDTIAACPTKAQKENGEYGGGMAEKPRVIRSAFRDLTPELAKADATLILVNQVYSTIGGPGGGGCESPGGGGIKFHCSIRAQVSRRQNFTRITPSGDEVTEAIISDIVTKKNKMTMPNQKVQMYFWCERGLDPFETVYHHCANHKIFEGSTWKKIKFRDQEYSFQNSKKLREHIEKVPDLRDFLDYQIYLSFMNVSPLMKVKLIDKIWEYEKRFFEKTVTKVTPEEIDLAKLLYQNLMEEYVREELELQKSGD